MVLPLIIGGLALASSIGLGTYYGLKNQEPDVLNQNSYITQNQYKSNEVIIGSNSKIGALTIKDKMTSEATTSQDASKSDNSLKNILLIAGIGAGSYFIYKEVKK